MTSLLAAILLSGFASPSLAQVQQQQPPGPPAAALFQPLRNVISHPEAPPRQPRQPQPVPPLQVQPASP